MACYQKPNLLRYLHMNYLFCVAPVFSLSLYDTLILLLA